MKVRIFFLVIIFYVTSSFSAIIGGTYTFYSSVTDNDILLPPASAAMGSSDLSSGSGTSLSSTPANLVFDTLSRLSLSYAGYFNNTFSTSILSWNSHPIRRTVISLLVGYIYIPDIIDTRQSTTTPEGELSELRTSTFSSSKILIRTGIARSFDITRDIKIGLGVAANGIRKRLPDIGYGVSLDAGAKTLFLKSGISIALSLRNATTSYVYWSKNFKERSYPNLYAGLGWEKYFPYISGSIKITYKTPDLLSNEGINSIKFVDQSSDVTIEEINQYEIYKKPSLLISSGRIGAEYIVFRKVALRAGFYDGRVSFGGGIYLFNEKAGIDIAYITHSLAGTFQVAVNYAW